MNKIQYHIKPIDQQQTHIKGLFANIVSKINTYNGVGANLEQDQNTARILFEGRGESSTLHVEEGEGDDPKVVLECEIADAISIDMLRHTIDHEQAFIYSPVLNCKLPINLTIRDCLVATHENLPKVTQILAKANLKPVFWLDSTYIYYAQHLQDKTIHMVNDNLLYYFLNMDSYTNTSELSYKVAENIDDFVSKFNESLIPVDFYEYYKKDFKIINHSNFDLKNVGRKVFIKPYIFEFDNVKNGFVQIAHDGSPLLFMDKIRMGETLNTALIRILKDELKIANDYIGAYVNKIIEFDLDRNSVLTPRLIVRVYIKEARMSEEQKQQKDRGWVSLNQVKG